MAFVEGRNPDSAPHKRSHDRLTLPYLNSQVIAEYYTDKRAKSSSEGVVKKTPRANVLVAHHLRLQRGERESPNQSVPHT